MSLLKQLKELGWRDDADAPIGFEGKQMLFVAGDKELGLSSKRTLDDTVVVIFRRNNSDALRGFNQPSKRANEPNTRSRCSFTKPELLPQNTIEFSKNESRSKEFDFSSPGTREDLVWLAARKAKAEIRTLVSRTIRIGGVDYLRTS